MICGFAGNVLFAMLTGRSTLKEEHMGGGNIAEASCVGKAAI
jgi:hypothetical protein